MKNAPSHEAKTKVLGVGEEFPMKSGQFSTKKCGFRKNITFFNGFPLVEGKREG